MTATREDVEALGRQIREAIASRDFRRADELMRERTRLAILRAKARDREDRAERRAQVAAWPTCGAPRADGKPCQARALWITGETTPRTRCRWHGGAQSPNAPRIRPMGAVE